jgi:hypothetical protein
MERVHMLCLEREWCTFTYDRVLYKVVTVGDGTQMYRFDRPRNGWIAISSQCLAGTVNRPGFRGGCLV